VRSQSSTSMTQDFNSGSAEACRKEAQQTMQYQFSNQLFNVVNHIDDVVMQPKEQRVIVLAFLPDPPRNATLVNPIAADFMTSEHIAYNDDRDRYSFFEVQGFLIFEATRIQNPEINKTTLDDTVMVSSPRISTMPLKGHESESRDSVNTTTSMGQSLKDLRLNDHESQTGSQASMSVTLSSFAVGPRSEWTESNSASCSPLTISKNAMAEATANSTSSTSSFAKNLASRLEMTPATEAANNFTARRAPEHQLALKFRARVCKSLFWADVIENGIDLEDCIVNHVYFKDFTIWNQSEIDLHWILNTLDVADGSLLMLSDAETGDPIETHQFIPGFGYRRIRISFRPKDIGEFNYDLQLENLNDSSNTGTVRIHAVVRSMHQEESLVISTGGLLDFGDCHAGTWSRRPLILKNIGDFPLDIKMSADHADVAFDLKMDDVLSTRPYERGTMAALSRSSTLSRGSTPSLDAMPVPRSPSVSSIDNEDATWHVETESPLSREPGIDRMEIEEVLVKPGSERVVEVWYRPEKNASLDEYLSGRLTKRGFRISLQYTRAGSPVKEKKM
jgi:hypothetical protein